MYLLVNMNGLGASVIDWMPRVNPSRYAEALTFKSFERATSKERFVSAGPPPPSSLTKSLLQRTTRLGVERCDLLTNAPKFLITGGTDHLHRARVIGRVGRRHFGFAGGGQVCGYRDEHPSGAATKGCGHLTSSTHGRSPMTAHTAHPCCSRDAPPKMQGVGIGSSACVTPTAR